MRDCFLIIAGLAMVGCASEPPVLLLPESGSVAAVAPSVEYHVGAGDVLRINVFGHPELSSQILSGTSPGTPIDGSGHIQLPLVGPVLVDGMTVMGIRATVTDALAIYLKEPAVDVAVVKFGSQRYIVLGETGIPGAYTLDRPMTALEALAQAGGFTESANRKQVIWMRGGLSEENLVMLDATTVDPKGAQLIQHGDVIFVGRRTWADQAEAIRDIIPLIQVITIPISTAAQVLTAEKLLNE